MIESGVKMDNTKDNGKVKIRENHGMKFHMAMKYCVMWLLTAGMVWSVIKIFDVKDEFSDGMSGALKFYTNGGLVLEIIIILLGLATLAGFFMNKKFCVQTIKFFFILLCVDRLFSFIMISLCSEASLVTTDKFLPTYALWNIRLAFFAVILAIVVIKYYNERKNMFN